MPPIDRSEHETASISRYLGRCGWDGLQHCGCTADWSKNGASACWLGLRPSEDAPSAQTWIKPFREAMRSTGWIEGGNIEIDYRFGGSLADLSKTKSVRSRTYRTQPRRDLFSGLPATLAVRQLTATIPIVFTQLIDPVGFGLAEGLGSPREAMLLGSLFGILLSRENGCQLLHDLMPDLAEVGVLFNPDTAPYASGLDFGSQGG